MDKDGAIKDFKKKFKDKTKNNWDERDNFTPVQGKYTMIEMDDGGDEEDEQEMAKAVSCKFQYLTDFESYFHFLRLTYGLLVLIRHRQSPSSNLR